MEVEPQVSYSVNEPCESVMSCSQEYMEILKKMNEPKSGKKKRKRQ
jgi:hypothetical protein